MDYVEWVEKVMEAAAKAWKEADANKKLVGLQLIDIEPYLCLSSDKESNTSDQSKLSEGLHDALRDLDAMGLVESEHARYFKLTREGSKYPIATLSTAWGQIMDLYLDDDQQVFLEALADIGQEIYDEYTCLKDLSGPQVFERLNWAWDSEGTAKCYLLAKQLSESGMIKQEAYLGGHIDIAPTYIGIVRVTRRAETELGKVVRECLKDWETTNVDFKRELNLKRDKQKAEFVRDMLGLVNTKSSGRRYLIIGFDDKTRSFHQSVDLGINQERIEQILTAYSEPAPSTRYHRVPWTGGEVGLIEVIRDAHSLPYKVRKDLAGREGIHEGEIYVRHGSHTESPTPRELEELIKEGERSRSA